MRKKPRTGNARTSRRRIAVHLDVGGSAVGKIELRVHAALDHLAKVEVAAIRDALVPVLVDAVMQATSERATC